MTPHAIARWAAAGESETQEFKETTGQRRLTNGATNRQIRDDLQVLRTLDLAAPSGRGRGARWRRRQG